MTQEQRFRDRYLLEIPVKVSNKPFPENQPVIDAVLSNISSGGVFVTYEHDFPIASKLYLEFSIQFEDLSKLQFILSVKNLKKFFGTTVSVQASGIVIRVEKHGSGIIFDQDYMLTPL